MPLLTPQRLIMLVFFLQPIAFGSWLPRIPEVQAGLGLGPAALALALLNRGEGLTRRSGQFLGQIAVDPFALTDKQFDWLSALAERAGLSDMMEAE